MTDITDTTDLIDRTKKLRPTPGGCSIGHYQITAGTLGCWVKKAGKWMILSNNHVLANCNEAEIGDPILQPGVYDGGELDKDELAKLYDFVEISMLEPSLCPVAGVIVRAINFLYRVFLRKTRFTAYVPSEPNLVDCAIAKPNSKDDVLNEILECESPVGVTEPLIGMKVKKSGRTTGLTHGEISQIDVVVSVDIGDGKTALFIDQFAIEGEGISAGGDSGSVILSEGGGFCVGLLFAGSENITLANRFSNVMEALGVAI